MNPPLYHFLSLKFLTRFSGIENNENFHAMAPETDEFFKSTWICRAATNASKYWEIFRSLPNNSVTSYYDQSHQSVRKWQNGNFFSFFDTFSKYY